MKICIDPGHGGRFPGAVYDKPFLAIEKKITLDVAMLLADECRLRGHKVILTRESDKHFSPHLNRDLLRRVEICAENNCEVFVSLHCNAGEVNATGIETFYHSSRHHSESLAAGIQRILISMFPEHRDRGAKPSQFMVLNQRAAAAVIVEMEFLSNPRMLEFLTNHENHLRLAEAIAGGIDAYESILLNQPQGTML